MRLHTMLLVACLTTVPAVAADGPDTGCSQTEYGVKCEGGLPPTHPLQDDGQQSQENPCQAVVYTIQTQYFPADVSVHPECIIIL